MAIILQSSHCDKLFCTRRYGEMVFHSGNVASYRMITIQTFRTPH